MLKNYLIIAIRNLKRNKVYSVINISGLSLGLACAMLIMLYTKDEFSFDRFHNDVNSIYRIVLDIRTPDPATTGKGGSTSILHGPSYVSAIPEIQSFVRYKNQYFDIRNGDDVRAQYIIRTDTNFFSMFSFPFLYGDPKTALIHPSSVVISEDLAKNFFGEIDPLNKIILIIMNDVPEPFTVTGVTRRCPQNSSIKFDMMIPLVVPQEAGQLNDVWLQNDLNTFVKLAPGADIATVETKMQQVFESEAKEIMGKIRGMFGSTVVFNNKLQSFTDIHLNQDFGPEGLEDTSKPVYSDVLTGIASFILLIASINFINLMVAQSVKRAKEIGIRKVVGGGRKQLIGQFLGESFLLTSLSFISALAVVQLGLPVFNSLVNKALSISYLFDMKLVSGYLLLFILTSLIAGFYPAFVLSGYNPVQTLYHRFQLTGKSYFQKGLVLFQFTLATLMIIATLTAYLQFNHLTTMDWGVDTKDVIVAYKRSMKPSESRFVKEELLRNPGIETVSFVGPWAMGGIRESEELKIFYSFISVDEEYIPLLSIGIISGRNFSPDFPADSNGGVIINETFAKEAGWKDPVGRDIADFDKKIYKIVGVVKDYQTQSPVQKITPHLLTLSSDGVYDRVYVKIKPNSEVSVLKHMETIFKKTFPTTPFDYTFLHDNFLNSLEAEARWKQIMLVGSVLTLFISCIGMFGLALFSAEKRFKEIGIRKVLGATVGNIVVTLSGDFLKLVLIAILIATPVSCYLANRWLESYPYRIEIKPWLFFASGSIVVLIAVMSVGYQSMKAALMNPVNSLKVE